MIDNMGVLSVLTCACCHVQHPHVVGANTPILSIINTGVL